jgi:6-phosphogluconolactonase (cycloisomerase 2 family)
VKLLAASITIAACATPSPSSPADAHRADARSIDAAPDASAPDAPLGGTARLYVANYLGGILAYDVDPASGAVHAMTGSPFGGTAHFQALAFDPRAPFAYAVDDAGELLTFAVAADGTLAAAAAAVAVGGSPESVAVDPGGRFVYTIADKAIAVFAIDATTGALAAIDHSPFATPQAIVDLAIEPRGRFLYASRAFMGGLLAYALDADTGAPAAIDGAPFGPSNVFTGPIAFSPDGRFAYSGGADVCAFRIAASGALELMSGSPLGVGGNGDIYPTSIAVTPDGSKLLSVATATDHVEVFALDPDSGAPSEVTGAPFQGGGSPYSVAIDPDGRFAYVGNDDAAQVSGFRIGAGGALAPVDGSPFAANGLQPQLVVTR